MHKSGTYDPTFWRVFGFLGTCVVLVAIGGAAAWALSDDTTEARDAFFYGLGAEGLLAGFIRGTTS